MKQEGGQEAANVTGNWSPTIEVFLKFCRRLFFDVFSFSLREWGIRKRWREIDRDGEEDEDKGRLR
jgi:hypothetical protein